jgi:mRNA interferase RelE/StbE
MITYEFTKQADRQLCKLPLFIQRRIVSKIKYYIRTGNPLRFATSVSGAVGKVYRFRIGDYRVIFDWEDGKIVVTEVGPRDSIYR